MTMNDAKWYADTDYKVTVVYRRLEPSRHARGWVRRRHLARSWKNRRGRSADAR
jgi:hypothetical protein